jgi:hypothetical protein
MSSIHSWNSAIGINVSKVYSIHASRIVLWMGVLKYAMHHTITWVNGPELEIIS